MSEDNKVVVFHRKERRMEPPRESMCEIVVYDNGDVSLWLADEVYTKEQFNWLFAKLAGSTSAIFGQKVERTAHE